MLFQHRQQTWMLFFVKLVLIVTGGSEHHRKIIQNMMGFFMCQTIKAEYKIGLNSCTFLETAKKKCV